MEENINKIPELKEGGEKHYVLISIVIIAGLFISYFLITGNSKISSVIPFGEDYKINKLRHDVVDKVGTADVKNCDKIEDERFRNICIDNINMTKARETGDITLCSKSTGTVMEVDTCILQNSISQALEKEDVSFCNMANKELLISECQKTYFTEIALIKNNINICNNALSENQKQYCRDFISNGGKI